MVVLTVLAIVDVASAVGVSVLVVVADAVGIVYVYCILSVLMW